MRWVRWGLFKTRHLAIGLTEFLQTPRKGLYNLSRACCMGWLMAKTRGVPAAAFDWFGPKKGSAAREISTKMRGTATAVTPNDRAACANSRASVANGGVRR